MKKEFMEAAKKGELIKTQNFITARGTYQIILIKHDGDIYFFKHLNGKCVECCNLSAEGKNDKT